MRDWCIHVKLAQPPSFFLKAPPLLYVFIFIALRALRFEARFVVLAGAVAAGAWLLLVLYVTRTDPSNPMSPTTTCSTSRRTASSSAPSSTR